MNSASYRPSSSLATGVCLAWLATASACGDAEKPRHIFIKFSVVPGETARPTHLEVSWLDDSRALFVDRRVPEKGSLNPDADPLATLDITPAPGSSGSRRILAFAYQGETRVLSGSGQLKVSDQGTQVFDVDLSSAPEPDRDGDRVPDEIDVCPAQDDFAGCGEPQMLNPDAGKPGGKPPGPQDGGVVADGANIMTDGPIAADAGGRDGAPAADGPVLPTPDSNPPVVIDTRPPDPQPDTRPPDPMPKTPPPPTGLMARFENERVLLTWTDNSNTEDAFVLWRVLGTTVLEIGTTATDVSLFIDSNPVRGATYTYRVAARNVFGTSDTSSTTLEIPARVAARIDGVPFGTTPAYAVGSEFDKAFDGNPDTFFDSDPANADNGYCGIDAGKGYVLTRIFFQPRGGEADRMVGGMFQGSNESSAAGFQTIHTITALPDPAGAEILVPGQPVYRYLRYQTPVGGYGNVAEIQFWGYPAPM